MKKIYLIIFTLIVLSVFFFSCKGDAGTEGAAGPAGPAGDDGVIMMQFQQGVFPSSAYAGCEDNDIISGSNQYSNYSGETGLSVGATGGSVYRDILKFDIQSLVPSNVNIAKAYLTIEIHDTYNNTINAYAITTPWEESTSSWVSATASTLWTTPGGDYGELQDSKGGWDDTEITFSLKPSLVQNWLSDPSSNNGIILIASQETGISYRNVRSEEYSPIELRPKLTIYYTLP